LKDLRGFLLHGWDEETVGERKSRFMSWFGEAFRSVVGPRVARALKLTACKYWWGDDGWICCLQ